MKNNQEKPEDIDDYFTKEIFKYICQFRLRSKIMKVLEDNFKVEWLPVISEKKTEFEVFGVTKKEDDLRE